MRRQPICLVVTMMLVWGMISSGHAQEGFGTNQPNKASVIDLTSTSKGLLIPRVKLTDLTTFAPMQGVIPGQEHTANSLLVYNTETVVTENITPGYYYWNKPDAVTPGKWVRLSTGGSPTLSQDLQGGTLTFDNGMGSSETYDIHWKLDENGTGLSTNNNEASGIYATAFGGGVYMGNPALNVASGDFSFVLGGFSNIGSGLASLVGGVASTASGDLSVAIGNGNKATGNSSTAFGHGTEAGGASSTAFGNTTKASGLYSAVFGQNTIASSSWEVVIGKHNAITTGTNTVFQIGNGSGDANRSNGFTVFKNGKSIIGSHTASTTMGTETLLVNGQARIANFTTGTMADNVVVADANGLLKTVEISTLAAPDYTRVFYMPSIVFDTSTPGADLTRNLYNEYVAQFTGKKLNSNGTVSADPSDTFVASTGAASTIPVLPNATDLYYYITDYDTTALANLSIDANGVLTYDVIGTGTDYSLVNIVFVVK